MMMIKYDDDMIKECRIGEPWGATWNHNGLVADIPRNKGQDGWGIGRDMGRSSDRSEMPVPKYSKTCLIAQGIPMESRWNPNGIPWMTPPSKGAKTNPEVHPCKNPGCPLKHDPCPSLAEAQLPNLPAPLKVCR